jgi:hypothetical protein
VQVLRCEEYHAGTKAAAYEYASTRLVLARRRAKGTCPASRKRQYAIASKGVYLPTKLCSSFCLFGSLPTFVASCRLLFFLTLSLQCPPLTFCSRGAAEGSPAEKLKTRSAIDEAIVVEREKATKS